MPRVAIVIDSYRVSGPAKGLLDFCASVRGRLDPVVLVFQQRRRENTEFREECERRCVPVQVIWEDHQYDVFMLGRALRMARSLQPDIIQTHGYKADVVGLAVRRRLGVPWVAFSHGYTDDGLKMRLFRTLDGSIIRRADRIIAVSEGRQAALLATGCPPVRLVTIRNAVNVPGPRSVEAGEVRRQLGLHEDRPVAAVVGRLNPEKGQSYFVDAMAQVTRAVPGAQGLIVGDGQQEGQLRARVAAMGLGEVIRFAGYCRDVDRLYPAIDLLVLPSLSEGLPNVVLEAMAHGRPVVGTRVGGVPEAVEDGVSGLLVAPADAHALAQAMVTLLRDRGRRVSMGAAARARVERSFSVRARAERILSVYGELLRHGRPAVHATPAPHLSERGVEVR